MENNLLAQKIQYLSAMGIDLYMRQELADALVNRYSSQLPATMTSSETDNIQAANHQQQQVDKLTDSNQAVWKQLASKVRVCTHCVLHEQRTQTVFGVGNHQADWMLVGEGPGFEEDRLGEPFVGKAGQLLNKMLLAIGLKREQVYIANVVKCRPPDNRNPRPQEIEQCIGYLLQQIELVQPKILLALGGVAANALLNSDHTVGSLRKQVHQFKDTNIPLIVTYHPAYLLRSPHQKRAAWEDLQMARKVIKTDY